MIVIINGASGAGKTFLLEYIQENKNNLFPIKKKTNRTEREFEKNKTSVDLSFGCSVEMIKRLKYSYSHKGKFYGIDSKELDETLNNGNIPVIIVRSFKIIQQLKNDYKDVKVIFIIGGTGEDLAERLKQQGRSPVEIENTTADLIDIIHDYSNNIDLVDYYIINSLYDKKILVDQFNYHLGLER